MMPGQVADAVAIGVEETARIDLVDRRAAPPRGLLQRRERPAGSSAVSWLKSTLLLCCHHSLPAV